MGDCRLRILVSKALLEKDSIISITECESFSKVYSADTTIREVMQDDGLLVDAAAGAAGAAPSTVTTSVSSTTTTAIRNVLSLLQDGRAKLWDCTKHPPQDITQWPLSLYSEIGGPQSKTLYDAGWYPSGSLQLLPFEVEYPPMAAADAYDDVQYNSKAFSSAPASGVVAADESLNTQMLVTTSSSSQQLLRPSQLLESVTHRFDHDDTVRTDHQASAAASLLRQQNKLAARQKERQRHQRLEARIRKLQEKQQESSSSSAGNSSNSSNKTVSEQVRRMLIKSRATGRANLEQQDRVYLHCLIDDCTTATTTTLGNDDEDLRLQEDYLYFSKQDTVGAVLSALKSKVASISNCANAVAELIVSTKQAKRGESNAATDEGSGGTGLYQRLPVLMRLYEAISLGYLQPVDEVVLRIYDPSKEDATESIDIIDKTPADLVTDGNDASAPMASSDSNQALLPPSGQQQQPPKTSTLDKREIESSGSNCTVVNARLGQALQVMDQNENKGKKKKVSVLKESAAVQKVKQMKIKSQAKGDAKRIKEMSDRFFVQLVTAVVDGNNNITCNLSLVFCSQRDTLDRLFRDCVKAPPAVAAAAAAAGNPDDWEWDFLTEDDHDDLDDDDDDALLDAITTPLPHHRFRRLDKKSTKSVAELESEGHVQNFGRLIVLFTKKSTGAK